MNLVLHLLDLYWPKVSPVPTLPSCPSVLLVLLWRGSSGDPVLGGRPGQATAHIWDVIQGRKSPDSDSAHEAQNAGILDGGQVQCVELPLGRGLGVTATEPPLNVGPGCTPLCRLRVMGRFLPTTGLVA